MIYFLTTTKGTRTVDGALDEAVATAILLEEELQPAFGVTISQDGETVAEVRDGQVEESPSCPTCGKTETIYHDCSTGRPLCEICDPRCRSCCDT